MDNCELVAGAATQILAVLRGQAAQLYFATPPLPTEEALGTGKNNLPPIFVA